MKDYIDKIRTISEGLDNPEVKQELDSIASSLDTQYTNLESKLKMTVKQSIGRKQKLSDMYQKLNDMDTLKLKLGQYQAQIQKLSKYHQAAVNQKKQYNNRIKTYFDTKLSNENHKDFNKFKTIYTQFNFESEDQSVLDSNKTKYELLQLAGTFGNEKLINATIPKPNTTNTKKPGTRFNKN